MLSAFVLAALTALTPLSDTISPVHLPGAEESSREALAAVHNQARRIVPLGGGRYLVVYPPRRNNLAGALMRGETVNEMPYIVVPSAALPQSARTSQDGGQMLDAALLDKSFAVSATALPVKGNTSGIIFYDFGPDFEPNPTLAVRLQGCVGAIAAGPGSSVLALTDSGITIVSRDGVVLGQLLKDAAGCDDQITRVDASR